MSRTDRKAVLVTRQTRLDSLIERFNTVDQARFYVEHLGADFSDYQREHRIYQEAVAAAMRTLGRFARVQRLDRRLLPNFLFPLEAVVVVVGQDGLVANTLKYLNSQPVIGVNPEPARWDGVLLPFGVDDLKPVFADVLSDKCSLREVTMARASLSDGQELVGVNDLFIGRDSHVSARYDLNLGHRCEAHSSSGVIVSTGLGSTGWLKSILNGAGGIVGAPLQAKQQEIREHGFAWDAAHLYFSAREPFPSRATQTELVFGQITRQMPLRLVSQMPEKGVIFSDGIEDDRLSFSAGMTATVDLADRVGKLVV